MITSFIGLASLLHLRLTIGLQLASSHILGTIDGRLTSPSRNLAACSWWAEIDFPRGHQAAGPGPRLIGRGPMVPVARDVHPCRTSGEMLASITLVPPSLSIPAREESAEHA
jgi:hypothetical protein